MTNNVTHTRLQQELTTIIQRLVNAEIDNSWKGGGDPADILAIEAELEAARLQLQLFFATVQFSRRD